MRLAGALVPILFCVAVSAAQTQNVDINGTWVGVIQSSAIAPVPVTYVFSVAKGVVSGYTLNDAGEKREVRGELSVDRLKISATVSSPVGSVEVQYAGVATSERITLEGSAAGLALELVLTRKK